MGTCGVQSVWECVASASRCCLAATTSVQAAARSTSCGSLSRDAPTHVKWSMWWPTFAPAILWIRGMSARKIAAIVIRSQSSPFRLGVGAPLSSAAGHYGGGLCARGLEQSNGTHGKRDNTCRKREVWATPHCPRLYVWYV